MTIIRPDNKDIHISGQRTVSDPDNPGADLLEVGNLSGKQSAQLYTWKEQPILARTKYIRAW